MLREPLFTTFDVGIPLLLAAGACLLFYAGVFLAKRIDWFDVELVDDAAEHVDPAPRLSLEDEARQRQF